MKVVIYTTNDCKFSQEEKAYLQSNNVAFEEKNLEANKDFLTEMLSISNNFAGTPVTEITKDNGEKVVLKGFTKEDFDTALAVSPAVSPALESTNTPVVEAPVQPQVADLTTPQSPQGEVVVPPVEMPVVTASQNMQESPSDLGVVDLSQSVDTSSANTSNIDEPAPILDTLASGANTLSSEPPMPVIEPSLTSPVEPVSTTDQPLTPSFAPMQQGVQPTQPSTVDQNDQLNSVLKSLENQTQQSSNSQ
jgi:glutaredoxin